MKTTNREDWNLGTMKDTIGSVALLVTAVAILVSGAINVHHQNALQTQQANAVSQPA
jgi:hypothetical protein